MLFSSSSGDLQHALRQFRRAPGFSILSIAILAAGIGASASMFTVVDQVLLRNLPYRSANQLVAIREAGKNGRSMFGAPFMDIQQWRERSHTLKSIAFHTYDKPTSFLSVGRSHHPGRSLLVVAQVALSFVLLVACGLLLRTIFAMTQVSLGFRIDHVIVADMVIPVYKFDGKSMTTQLYEPLVAKVEHLPEVQAAALTTGVPLGKRFPVLLTFSGADTKSRQIENLVVQFRAVSPGLQGVLGFRMLRGRFFSDSDTAGSAPVVVVNRAFVKQYFGDNRDPGDALNQELLSYGDEKLAHIIGVIDDERQSSILEASKPEVEVCIPQITPNSGFYRVAEGLGMNLVVRTDLKPAVVIPELRKVFRGITPELAGSSFTTMEQVIDDSYGDRRMASHLLQLFAGSALLLCMVGLYGILTYTVTQRTQEMGVRLALGAQKGQLIWLVMGRAVLILTLGSSIGLALSFGATRAISSMMYGVRANDVITLTASIVLVIMAGLLASYIPAKRAANVDPVDALRAE